MTSKDAIEVGVNGDNQRTSLTTILPSPPPSLSQLSIPQEAAIGVVKGSVGCSALMGIGGMIYGALRAQPAILYGLQAGTATQVSNRIVQRMFIFEVYVLTILPLYIECINHARINALLRLEKRFGLDV